MKVHYPKLYNMAHLSLNVFTASKGSNNYILFGVFYVILFSFPAGVYVGTLNLIESIPDPSIRTTYRR